MTPPPPVSIIVPTYNAGATIEACLRGIIANMPEAGPEVIVVDNGSTDATLEIVRRFPVRLEVLPRGFVSHSRNVGAQLAGHDILAFVDSDCVVQPGWCEAIGEVILDSSVGIAGSRYSLREDAGWVERAWDQAHRREAFLAEEVRYVPAGNMAIRKAVFLRVEGFDERLETGEDMDLCARLAAAGYRVLEIPAIKCVHLGEPRTLREVFRRNRWHGRGARLRYSDGRIAPVTMATVLFAASAALAALGVIGAGISHQWWWDVLALSVFAVPLVYAMRYARPRRPAHVSQLAAVYSAYFLGRAAALPVVCRRLLIGGRPHAADASHRRP